ATKIIRNTLKSTVPIIALTASALIGSKEQMLEAGMNDFLTKPFHPDELLNKLFKYLNIDTKEAPSYLKIDQPVLPQKKLYSLDGLVAMFGKDPEPIVEMIHMFISTTPPLWEELLHEFDQKNYVKIAALAHKIKASVNIMDIRSLKEVIFNIGENAIHNDENGL